MGVKTGIEWTDATWNPVRGCSRVSEGCRYCYAEGIAARFSGELPTDTPGVMKPQPFHLFADRNKSGSKWTGKVALVEEHLNDPLSWRAPRKIFVNSMSDLFHENLPEEDIDQVFAVMSLCPQHTFQILTKRPARMRDYFGGDCLRSRISAFQWGIIEDRVDPTDRRSDDIRATALDLEEAWPLPNVWLGVSVEDQETADERIPVLLRTPAAIRFVSYEPALGPVDFGSWTNARWQCAYCGLRSNQSGECKGYCQDPSGNSCDAVPCPRCGKVHYWCGSHGPGVDWIIVGGESGRGARPMHPDWARNARDQCQNAGVRFFFKQWGAFASVSEVAGKGAHYKFPDGATVRKVGKKAAGAFLDGREWKEFPR